ncbi:hypothetical protein [Bacillus sp. JCM 19041]
MQVQEEELMEEDITTIDRYSVFAFRTGEKVEILKTVDMPLVKVAKASSF